MWANLPKKYDDSQLSRKIFYSRKFKVQSRKSKVQSPSLLTPHSSLLTFVFLQTKLLNYLLFRQSENPIFLTYLNECLHGFVEVMHLMAC